MLWVTVGSKDGHFVSQFLQADSSINDKSLSPTDPEIWVEENNGLLGRRRRGFGPRLCFP